MTMLSSVTMNLQVGHALQNFCRLSIYESAAFTRLVLTSQATFLEPLEHLDGISLLLSIKEEEFRFWWVVSKNLQRWILQSLSMD